MLRANFLKNLPFFFRFVQINNVNASISCCVVKRVIILSPQRAFRSKPRSKSNVFIKEKKKKKKGSCIFISIGDTWITRIKVKLTWKWKFQLTSRSLLSPSVLKGNNSFDVSWKTRQRAFNENYCEWTEWQTFDRRYFNTVS